MTIKDKGRTGRHRSTPKTYSNQNFTASRPRLEALIATLAVWGLLPVGLANRLIRYCQRRDTQ